MIKSLVMDSEYCSMGRWISLIVAEHLQMKFYEAKDLLALSEETWLTVDFLNSFEERIASMGEESLRNDELFQSVHSALSRAIKKAVELGPCIIHEKAATHILAEKDNILKVMLYNGNQVSKIPRAKIDTNLHLENASDDEVTKAIEFEDRKRKVYHNAVSPIAWGAKEGYDLCLDSNRLGREKCAEILIEALKDVKLDEEECKRIILKLFETVL